MAILRSQQCRTEDILELQRVLLLTELGTLGDELQTCEQLQSIIAHQGVIIGCWLR
jgi:hypothetical protein